MISVITDSARRPGLSSRMPVISDSTPLPTMNTKADSMTSVSSLKRGLMISSDSQCPLVHATIRSSPTEFVVSVIPLTLNHDAENAANRRSAAPTNKRTDDSGEGFTHTTVHEHAVDGRGKL